MPLDPDALAGLALFVIVSVWLCGRARLRR